MPIHKERRILPYSPQQVFDVVLDVAAYPQFLPWCRATRVQEKGEQVFKAEVVVGYKMLSERYQCLVRHQAPHSIEAEYLKGPFKHLGNHWQFTPIDNGCQVDFFIAYEFKNRLLQSIANSLFQEIVQKMVSAFENRANQLYGTIAA